MPHPQVSRAGFWLRECSPSSCSIHKTKFTWSSLHGHKRHEQGDAGGFGRTRSGITLAVELALLGASALLLLVRIDVAVEALRTYRNRRARCETSEGILPRSPSHPHHASRGMEGGGFYRKDD